jgi:glycosyltransferase involved in cell wall biosynthesis
LIEAMGREAMVLYLSNPENEEAARDAGIPYEAEELAEKLQWAAGVSEQERLRWGCLARKRVQERYSWDAVTDTYEQLLHRMRRK